MRYEAPRLIRFGSALRLTLGARAGTTEMIQFKV
jgi:hypothetical protein